VTEAAAGVSVVIPVKGRVEPTRRLAASLAVAAANCPEPVEVLLVDDSAEPQARQHRITCDRNGIRYVPTVEPYVGAKRNIGIGLAKHDLLMFTDSDCLVGPDALRRHVEAVRSAPARVAGVAGPTFTDPSPTTMFRIMRNSHLLNWDFERPAEGGELVWATTSNLMLRRAAVEEVGGFPSRCLDVVGGEDLELGIRLSKRGYVIRAVPDAVVTHDSMCTDSVRTVCRRLYGYGRSEQWLSTVHPDRRVPHANLVTALGLTASVSAALVRRTRGRSLLLTPVVAGAAVAVGALRRYRAERPPPKVGDVALRTVLEWCFDAGAVVAAIRLRRPTQLFTGFRAEGKPGADRKS
jgi:GT2 family glycosyltransferase